MALENTKRKIDDFKLVVRKGMLITPEQEELFNKIEDNIWDEILTTNFKGNLEYARRVILSKVDIIEQIDDVALDKEKAKINNLQFAVDRINTSIDNEEPIIFITDYDNDGSLAQSVINQYINIEERGLLVNKDQISVEYARAVGGNNARGLTLELVDDIVKEKNIDINKPFLLITADNGINSVEEQKRIQAKYKNAELIITDHHEPEKDMVVEENERTIIVNPKYNAMIYQTEQMQKERGNTQYPEIFEKYNISGATTVGVLLKSVLSKYEGTDVEKTSQYKTAINIINKLSKASNVLDYVDSMPEDKLYVSEEITKYIENQSLLNVNNSMTKFITKTDENTLDLDKLSKFIGADKVNEIQETVFVLNKYAQVVLSLIVDYQQNKKDSLLDISKKDLIKTKNEVYGFNKMFLYAVSALNYLDSDDNLVKKMNLVDGINHLEELKNFQEEVISIEEDIDEINKQLKKLKKDKSDFGISQTEELNKALEELIKNKDDVDAKISKLNVLLNDMDLSEYSRNILNLVRKDEIFNELYKSNNTNYIEQLRPHIFSFLADGDKDKYEEDALNMALKIFKRLRTEERNLMVALREVDPKLNLIKEEELDNVNIVTVNPEVTGVLNRKIINKAFNKANNGFYLTFDGSYEDDNLVKISGSFRSLFDIEDIVSKVKDGLAKTTNDAIKIETPGHKRAAGFIITVDKAKLKEKNITFNQEEFLKQLAKSINSQIDFLKNEELKKIKVKSENDNKDPDLNKKEIETDAYNIDFINKFNETVRGNIPHFKAINPLVKLHEDFVIVNQKTGKQITLDEYVEKHRYGYAHLQIELPKHGEKSKNLIVPIELLRKVVKSGKDKDGYYKDYVRLGYMDDGLFIVNNVVKESLVDKENVIVFNKNSETSKKIDESFKDGKLDKVLNISNKELSKISFFDMDKKYGERNFELFENMLIQLIDSNNVDMYTTFDVEANGFSRAKMFNLGAANFEIDKASGKKINLDEFKEKTFFSLKNKQYLFNNDDLEEISKEKYAELLNKNELSRVFFKIEDGVKIPYLYVNKDAEKEGFSFNNFKVNNYKVNGDEVIYNRKIIATSLSRLVKEEDFKLPIYMTYLTGVKNEHLDKYGKPIKEVDDFFADFYKGKKLLIGAHNTRYDLGITEANTNRFYNEVLMNLSNIIFDSCTFSRNAVREVMSEYMSNPLAYDNMSMVKFEGVPEIKSSIIFYNNRNSKLNLIKFLEEKTGQFPDRTGNYRLSFENDELYIYSYKNNSYEKVKISTPYENLTEIYDENAASNLEELNAPNAKTKKAKKKEASKYEKYISSRDFNKVSYQGKMTILDRMPTNSVKYSAQALSDFKVIRTLLLDDKDFDVKMVTDFSKYPSLEKYKTGIQEFLATYRFDQTFYQSFEKSGIIKGTALDDLTDDIVALEKDFIELNNDLINCFNDAWYYKAILDVKDPKRKDLNQESYEIVSAQTGFDIEIVKEVLNKAYEFKKKNKITGSLMQPEIHVNGPMDGDVLFETPLTLTLLATKTMDTNLNDRLKYNRDYLSNAVNVFNEKAYSFTTDLRINRSERSLNMAEDSMGFIQLLDYHREKGSHSKMVEIYKDKNSDIENYDENVVYFKLSAEVLPNDTKIVAITNDTLDVETIREDSLKIAEIVKIRQSYIVDGLNSEGVNKILNENKEKIEETLDDLSKRYRYLELFKGPSQKEKLNEMIFENATKNMGDIKFLDKLNKFMLDSSDDMTVRDFIRTKDLVEDKIKQFEYQYKAYMDPEKDLVLDLNINLDLTVKYSNDEILTHLSEKIVYFKSVLNSLNEKIKNDIDNERKTSLEIAFESENVNYIKDGMEEFKEGCLNGRVRRLDPVGNMMKYFDFINLSKNYVSQKYNIPSVKKDIKLIEKINDKITSKLDKGLTITLKNA